jgi:hypothetical protein
MNCPVCDHQISFASYNVCSHRIYDGDKHPPKYSVLYTVRYNERGETIVIPYFGLNAILTMVGLHILTIERIEKLLLLQ